MAEGDRPIRWLLLADGDAATDVRRAHQDAGLRLPRRVRDSLNTAAKERGNADRMVFVAATQEVNRRAVRYRTALHLSPIDLEFAVVQGCSDPQAHELSERLDLSSASRNQLEATLRSDKKPYRRAALAAALDWSTLSTDTRTVLRRWLEPVMTRNQAVNVLRQTH